MCAADARAATSRRNIAVVLAGGTGTRVGLHTPKQLVKVAGKTIIEHTIACLHSHPAIDEVLILMTPGYVDDVAALVRDRYPKVSRVLPGGDTRNDTTKRALDALGDEDANVLLHDAVRPLVDQRIISDCLKALQTFDAVDVAIPSADTIIEVRDGDQIASIPDRSMLRRGQTPQAFRLTTIRAAYELAMADPGFSATDDCSVVLRYLPDVPIFVVTGSEQNLKVTHPIDLFLADRLFQLASSAPPLTSGVYATLLRDKTLVVFGGSYGIGGELAAVAERHGATAFAFSRTTTGTYVERAADVAAALKKARTEAGRIDFVVNTAGVLEPGALADLTDTAIEDSVRTNLLAPISIARLALPYLQQTHGQLLLFTSSSYTRGRANYSVYSATKAAVVNLTQALAEEWSGLGVRINCINPERTRTPMRERAFGVEPPETLLDTDTVALAALDVLLSDMTGHVIDVRKQIPAEAVAGETPVTDAELVAFELEAVEAADDEVGS